MRVWREHWRSENRLQKTKVNVSHRGEERGAPPSRGGAAKAPPCKPSTVQGRCGGGGGIVDESPVPSLPRHRCSGGMVLVAWYSGKSVVAPGGPRRHNGRQSLVAFHCKL